MRPGIGTQGYRAALLVLASIAVVACGGGGDSAPAPPSGPPSSVDGVSGTASHGNSLTITGTSFGTKSHAGPMLFDDFDDASATNINGREPQIHQGNLDFYNSWERTVRRRVRVSQAGRAFGGPSQEQQASFLPHDVSGVVRA